MYTLGREFQVGVNSKHSKKFHFEEFSFFIRAMKAIIEADRSLSLQSLEEFLLRVKFFANRQTRVKDTFLFWVAHAKL